jgi:nitrous oxidase accessory protein NosD
MKFRILSLAIFAPLLCSTAFAANTDVQCGDTITSNSKLKADLDCTGFSGNALVVSGDNITFNGNGYKILAPHASNGIFVEGKNDTIENVTISGVANGNAIMAYDAPAITISGNNVSGSGTGIYIYADTKDNALPTLSGNNASHALYYGIRMSESSTAKITLPVLANNDVSYAGAYGMALQAQTLVLSGLQGNKFNYDVNGLALSGGQLELVSLDFSQSNISGTAVFASAAQNVFISSSNLSTNTPGNSNQGRIGASFYRVEKVRVKSVIASNTDTGIFVSTDSGVSSDVRIHLSNFSNETLAGIRIQSNDSTAFGTLRIRHNDLSGSPYGLWISNGTTYAADSVITPNDL